MTTRISERGPLPLVEPTRTAPRVTPSTSQPFRAVMQASARAVVDSAEGAVRHLPGGPVLAAAFRAEPPNDIASGQSRSEAADARFYAEGPPPSSSADPMSGHQLGADMPLGAEQNMHYLKLQQQVSAESRQYTALSNVLKARHDMVKNAIGNIR